MTQEEFWKTSDAPRRPVRTPDTKRNGVVLALRILLTVWTVGTAVVAAAQSPLPAHRVAFPAKAEVINVTLAPYYAKGDGVTDDTAALARAIADAVSVSGENNPQPLYLPAGTYLVSGPLEARDVNRNWQNKLAIYGEQQDKTVLKLKDHCSGFEDRRAHLAVVTTASPGDAAGNGAGNSAFGNFLCDLTVDTGTGNPGAVGIAYHVSNIGELRNVTVRSDDGAGYAAIAFTRADSGPGMLHHVSAEGFDFGILYHGWTNSLTVEDLHLHGQHVCGLRTERAQSVLAVRHLVSDNDVPAIQHYDDTGLLTITDSVLKGGTPAQAAIESKGALFVRGVRTSGYGVGVRQNGGTVAPAGRLAEYASDQTPGLFGGPTRSLDLPVKDAPDLDGDSPGGWASVSDFGAVPGDGKDDTAAIQAAIDSGARTVYFPVSKRSHYEVSGTIHVRGKVRRIEGLGGALNAPYSFQAGREGGPPLFRIESGAGPVAIQGLNVAGPIEHVASRPLLLRDDMLSEYRAVHGAGDVFVEDIAGGTVWRFDCQNVWARQLNPERYGMTHVINNGGRLWILGYKLESIGPTIATFRGQTELMGAMLPATTPISPLAPVFVSRDSAFSFSGVHYSWDGWADGKRSFNLIVRETQNGRTRRLWNRDIPHRLPDAATPPAREGFLVPLYVTRPAETLPAPEDGRPLVRVSTPIVSILPGGSGSVLVHRFGDVRRALTLRYAAGGTAVAGLDYRRLTGTLTFPAGRHETVLPVLALRNPGATSTRLASLRFLSSPEAWVGYPDTAAVNLPASGTSDTAAVPRGGQALWVRADGPLLLNDQGEVTRWTDTSGSGNDLSRPPTTYFPGWSPQAMSGRPAVTFSGDWLEGPRTSLGTGRLPGRTVLIAFQTPADVQTRQLLWNVGSGQGLNVYLSRDYLCVHADFYEEGRKFLRTRISPNTSYAVTVRLDQSTGTLEGYLNGTLFSRKDRVPQLEVSQMPYTVGAKFQGVYFPEQQAGLWPGYDIGDWFQGVIAEVMDYHRALSDSELSDTLHYLRTKYRLPRLTITPLPSEKEVPLDEIPADYGRNVTRMGGFEHDYDYEMAVWRLHPNGDGARLELDKAVHHSGVYSLRISDTRPSAAAPAVLEQRVTSLRPFQRYHLTLWARGDGVGKAWVGKAWAGAGASSAALPAGTFDWTLFGIDFVAPEDTVYDLTVSVSGPTRALWVDDVEVKEVNP